MSHAKRGRMPKWCHACKSVVVCQQHREQSRLKSSVGYERQCRNCLQTWRARSPKASFCSNRCQNLFYGTRKTLNCAACGIQFDCTAREAAAGRQYCSRTCMLRVRRRPAKPCLECGKLFSTKPKKDPRKGKGLYCSKRCAGAARRAGKREGRWKEGQELRERRAKVKPSQRMYAAMQDAMRRQLKSIASLSKAMNSWRFCRECGGSLKQHATERTMFCSIRCAAQYQTDIPCACCGVLFVKQGVHGSNKALCFRCKRMARRRHRTHRNIASRARKHGVLREQYSRKELLERDGWECQLCGVALLRKWTYHKQTLIPHPRNATLDHIVAMACGGADAAWNIQACCFACNCRKSDSSQGQLRLRL